MGPKIARKHIGWYLSADTRFNEAEQRTLKRQFNGLETPISQLEWIKGAMACDAAARLFAKGSHAA